jgi:type I restriction enzyme, S subunit
MANKWIDTSLGEVLTLQRGFDLPETERKPRAYPVIASTGPIGSHREAMVQGPGVVIGRSGSLGGGQFIEGEFWPLNTTLWVKDFKGNDRRFCYYLLKSLDLAQFNAGSGVPTLNRNHIHPLPVRVPTEVDEQRAIAHILGTLDDKIELNRKQNETLEAMARGLFKAWFVNFEPVRAKIEGRWQRGQSLPGLPAHLYDLFLDRLVESELGEIPEGWRIGSVYDIADVRYGAPFASAKFNSNGNGLPLVRIRDLRDERPGVWTPEVHPKGYLIQPGDIIVGMDGEFRAYLWGGDPAWMNQRICAFHSKQPYCPVFVRNAIEPHLARVEATEIATTVIHLGKGDIDEFRVVIPEDKVAREFERLGQSLFDKIVLSKQQSAILAEQRDTLLPKLISGELRVPDAERILGAVV